MARYIKQRLILCHFKCKHLPVTKILRCIQTDNGSKLSMWVNAQHDSRPAEYRWRPLFNAAKFG